MLNTIGMIRTPVVTIDDCTRLTGEMLLQFQKLSDYLQTLEKYKHPLAVRKGKAASRELENVGDTQDSVQIKAKSRTYFLDIKPTTEGKRYLKITENRMKGKDGKPERNQIILFPEAAPEFVKTLSEMAAKLV